MFAVKPCVSWTVLSQNTSNSTEKRVEAPGIEARATSARNVGKRRENDANLATKDDARRQEVSASTPMGADEAIRVAAKLAIDTGDLVRTRALLDLLDVEPRFAPVVPFAARKSRR